MHRSFVTALIALVALGLTNPLFAEDDEAPSMDALVNAVADLRAEVAALRRRVAELESGDSAPANEAPAPDARSRVEERERMGLARFLVTTRPISALEQVTREHIIGPDGTVSYLWARPEEMPDGACRSPIDVLGRVVRREKRTMTIFLETDFFPRGTRPGPMAGVPEGRRGIWLDGDEIPGLVDLRRGDTFDLLMTTRAKVDGEERVETRVVARRANVVEPASGETRRVFVSVGPRDAATVSLARGTTARFDVALRSGRVDEAPDDEDVPDLGWTVDDPKPIPVLPDDDR